MDVLNAIGIQIITWLQSLGTGLMSPMEGLSFLGNEQFFLLVAPAIYWCFDTRLGLTAGLFLMVNANINSYLKIILHTPRPFWISTAIQHLGFEQSFGMPSGHAQNTAVVWGTLAAYFRKPWTWIASIGLIILIGISRIYLGVHFPHDILAGWIFGAITLWALIRLSEPITRWIHRQSFATQILATLAAALIIILIGVLSRLAISGFVIPEAWIQNAASSHPEEPPINPTDITGIISNAAAFFGLAAGALWMQTRGGFRISGSAAQRLGRYLLGVVGVFLFWFGLGEIFPRGETWLPYLLRFFRYSLVGLWVTALAPMLFIKVRLASRNHENNPE